MQKIKNVLAFSLFILLIFSNYALANSMDMLMGNTTESAQSVEKTENTSTSEIEQEKTAENLASSTDTNNVDNLEIEQANFLQEKWLSLKTTYYKYQLLAYKYVSELLIEINSSDKNQPVWVLIFISFIYGVLHALGPGHGKILIATYLTSENTQIKSALKLAFIAAQVQSLTAIILVLGVFYFVKTISSSMAQSLEFMYYFSAAVLVALSIWLFSGALKKFASIFDKPKTSAQNLAEHKNHKCEHSNNKHSCNHKHLEAKDLNTNGFLQEFLIVLSIGLRPCTGSIMILSFSLALGIVITGILSAIVVGLGVGLTMLILAILTVYFRDLAIKFMHARGKKSSKYFALITAGIKLLAGVIVFILALILFSSESLQGLESILR